MASYQNQPANPSGSYHSLPREHTTVYIGTPEHTLFNTKEIRAKFVSKVFTIVFYQILAASALIAWFSLNEPTRKYMQENGAIYLYVSFAVAFIALIVLSCVPSARRTYPTNFILLIVITLSFGIIAAVTAARFEAYTVLGAFCATAFAVLVIVLLAKYSPFDVTTCGCALCVLLMVHMFASILLTLILVPMGYASIASVFIASTGALLVSLYMVFDLQLIMGGRSVEISPEEYITASVTLYLDIINLFQYMLILLGDR